MELVRQVEAYGLPFARSLATPGALVAALRDGKHLALEEYARIRLPATLASLGLGVEAREAMASGLRELGDRMDAAADQVRAFSDALLVYLDGTID